VTTSLKFAAESGGERGLKIDQHTGNVTFKIIVATSCLIMATGVVFMHHRADHNYMQIATQVYRWHNSDVSHNNYKR